MGDGFSLSILKGPWDEAQREIHRKSDRATMYALRAVGRRLRAEARRRAPVYSGNDPRALAEAGSLKKSIKSSRRMTSLGSGTYEMKVMPVGSAKQGTSVVRHGTRNGHHIDSRTAQHLGIAGPSVAKGESTKGQVRGVVLYRRQMEAKYGYMADGTDAASAVAKETFEAAYAKALEKYR